MKSCGVYDLMIDVVEMWLKDYGIKAPDGAWLDLIARLGKCEKDLTKVYDCKKRGWEGAYTLGVKSMRDA